MEVVCDDGGKSIERLKRLEYPSTFYPSQSQCPDVELQRSCRWYEMKDDSQL